MLFYKLVKASFIICESVVYKKTINTFNEKSFLVSLLAIKKI